VRILLLLFFYSSQSLTIITLEEIDYFNSISEKNNISIISSGTEFCNNYFSNQIGAVNIENKFKNIFLCKFSKKRNRFYIYMLSVDKKENIPLRDFCKQVIEEWPSVLDHMDEKLSFQNKDYLQGFYVENFFFDKVISFSNNFENDQQIIRNEIDNFILRNRDSFSENNILNNQLIKQEQNKLQKIYKKIISKSMSDLDLIIKSQLKNIVRYKIFINDIKNFQSYSCNWKPGKGFVPYIKREKFNEFENS